MTTIGNMELMTPEDTQRTLAIADKFLSDVLASERIPELGEEEIPFALGASIGQLLFMASAMRTPGDPGSQLSFVAGLASGLVSNLYQAIGPASVPVLSAALRSGLDDGLNRCSALYGADKKGRC